MSPAFLSRADAFQPSGFVDHFDAELAGFVELRAGARTGDDEVGLAGSLPETLAPSRSACALISSRVIFSSEPVKTIVLPASGLVVSTASIGSGVISRQQRIERRLVVRLGEEIGDGLGRVGPRPSIESSSARASKSVAALIAVLRKRVERAEVAREAPRIGLADMADAERKEEAVERRVPPRFDRGEKIAHRSLAETFPFAQVGCGFARRACSVKMSAGVRISPSLKNSSISLSPRPSMSKALREQKCFSPSTACAGQIELPVQRRTTSASPFSSISRKRRRAADRADLRKHIGLGAARPLVEHDLQNLRDDVAGALDAHGVADADVLARDLVLVVQRRIGDDDAADRHRIELRDRRQRAGAADVDFDAAQDGRRLFGRELVRDRPARRARDEAEPLLQVDTSTL